jgi:hydroxyethylthiazole kinase-like uncharacterized protein yjeF
MRLSDSQKMREADKTAIYERRIPGALLMTRAAEHLVKAALELLPAGKSVCIFCGSGNNGGDGVAAADILLRCGIPVRALLTGSREKMTADTAEMERRLNQAGGSLENFSENFILPEDCGLIIDAMFGIGLNSPLRGRALAAAEMINSSGLPVVAADIPSGVEADTGAVPGAAVRADVTVTFSMAKPGHYAEPGCVYAGEVRVCDIGIPADLLERAQTGHSVIMEEEISLPKRGALTHKYSYGRLLILGGSLGYTGAVSLCSRAAVRTGAGVVFTGIPKDIYSVTAVKNDEAVVFPLDSDEEGRFSLQALPDALARLKSSSAAVLGPGLGRSEVLADFTEQLISASTVPMVLDADALYAVGQNPDVLLKASAPMILTPHEGEFRTLGGKLNGGRLSAASAFAQKYNCTLILKGHHSIAAFPDGETAICPYGNPGMAKGGSGDVLAGILGALLCQLPLRKAVETALYIHAAAGDLCADKFGEYSMTPTDMINCIYMVTKHISAR